MTRALSFLLIVLCLVVSAGADDPLQRANYREHLSGPELGAGELTGKVVLLEYFGYH